MPNIISIINQLLSYSDTVGQTDNPVQRSYDFRRQLSGISSNRAGGDNVQVPPGESSVIFDGTRTTLLSSASVLSISLMPSQTSTYEMTVTSGPSGFRTARSLTSITNATVTINNNSVATFTFPGATFTGVVVGDVLRIKGANTNDVGAYSFNSLNSGLWRVIAVSGSTLQVTRPVGDCFSGVAETVTTVNPADVQVYSSSGVQSGDSFEIKSVFSLATRRVYVVDDATPNSIQFTSTLQIPEESGVSYPDPVVNGDSIIFYTNSKRFVYVEVDQNVSIKFDNDPGEYNKITPLLPGDPNQVGFLSKFGSTYKVEIVNKSVDIVNVKYFVAE